MATLKDADKPQIPVELTKKLLLKHWYWFAISLVFFLGVGFLYLKVKAPLYNVYGTMMFNQNEDESAQQGLLGSLMSSFSMGNSSWVSVEDEIFKIQAHSTLKKLTIELGLNRAYVTKPGLLKKKIYHFNDSPLKIEIPEEVLDTMTYATDFRIKISDNGKEIHVKVKQGEYRTVFDDDIKGFPHNIQTPLGMFTITTTPYFKPEEDLDFRANLCSADFYVSDFREHFGVAMESKKSNAITLQTENCNIEMGKAIINHLMDIYNKGTIEDREAQSRATLQFLEERLVALYKDLDGSETTIANYKRTNNIVDPDVEAKYIFDLKQQADSSLIELEAQLAILRMVKEFLDGEQNRYALIPFAGGAKVFEQGSGITASIDAYNTLALEHMKLESNAKGSNTVLKQIESQLDALRKNLIISVDRTISATKISEKRISGENGQIQSRITSMPKMEQDLTNLYRDKEIKNQVYAYLLQKREETEIKLSRVLPSGKIIDEAYVDPEQESPKKGLVIAAMIFLAVAVPSTILYIRNRKCLVDKEQKQHIKEMEKEMNEIIG